MKGGFGVRRPACAFRTQTGLPALFLALACFRTPKAPLELKRLAQETKV